MNLTWIGKPVFKRRSYRIYFDKQSNSIEFNMHRLTKVIRYWLCIDRQSNRIEFNMHRSTKVFKLIRYRMCVDNPSNNIEFNMQFWNDIKLPSIAKCIRSNFKITSICIKIVWNTSKNSQTNAFYSKCIKKIILN